MKWLKMHAEKRWYDMLSFHFCHRQILHLFQIHPKRWKELKRGGFEEEMNRFQSYGMAMATSRLQCHNPLHIYKCRHIQVDITFIFLTLYSGKISVQYCKICRNCVMFCNFGDKFVFVLQLSNVKRRDYTHHHHHLISHACVCDTKEKKNKIEWIQRKWFPLEFLPRVSFHFLSLMTINMHHDSWN